MYRYIKAHVFAVLALVIWLVFATAIQRYMVVNQLSFLDVLDQFQTILRESWYGVLLYFLLYLIRPLLFLPGTVLTVLAGSVFGIWPGFLYAFLAGLMSGIPAYVVGRWFSDGRTTYGVLERFVSLIRRNPFQAVLMMRFVYLPYDMVNVFCGVMHIPFRTYILATALGNLGGAVSFITIGASLQGNLASGDFSLNLQMMALSGVLVIAGLLISRYVERFQPPLTPPTDSSEDTHDRSI